VDEVRAPPGAQRSVSLKAIIARQLQALVRPMLAHAHPQGLTLYRPASGRPPALPVKGTLKAPGPAPTLPESQRAPHRCSVANDAGAPSGLSLAPPNRTHAPRRSGPTSIEARRRPLAKRVGCSYRPNGSRLSCGRPSRRRKGSGRQSVPRQGHNTLFPLERSPPASFKRLLGGALGSGRGHDTTHIVVP